MTVPGNLSSPLLATAAAAAAGDVATKSLRFNDDDQASLSRTPSSAGNRKTFTYSCWFKRANITRGYLFSVWNSDTDSEVFAVNFSSSHTLNIDLISKTLRVTDQVFRDPSAWYHLVLAVDTTQSTASDRLKLYINGSEVTSFSTNVNFSQNDDTGVNGAFAHQIGRYFRNSSTEHPFDGSMADIYMIDGSQLDPTSFGAFDDSGVWQAAAYSGTYGTNGFHLLDFENESTVGHDSSGNENDWTANNISTTAGAGNDVLFDVPTNGTQSDTGAGGEVSGNYATMNSAVKFTSDNVPTFTNGNLKVTGSSGTSNTVSTIGTTSGKFYFEVTLNAAHDTNSCIIGLGQSSVGYSNNKGIRPNGNYNGTITSGSAFTFFVGDTIGIAFEPGVSATFFKNNNEASFVATCLSGDQFAWMQLGGTTVSATFNFGQRSFVNQSVPSNFKALCTTNLPTPTIADGSDYFETKLYTGNGANSRTISGLGFSPDFLWVKNRDNTAGDFSHRLMDAVRGAGNSLSTNSNAIERDSSAQPGGGVETFTSDGFTIEQGTSTNDNQNKNNSTYVAWAWDAGTSTVSNTDGSITSSVRANQSAGFSVVTFTQSGSSGDIPTVGHGLNAAPEMIFLKSRSNAQDWRVFHTANGVNKTISLNSTGAAGTVGSPPAWSVSGSTFGAKNGQIVDSGYTYVAYCFAPVAGYSAISSFEANGSTDGPFVHLGFRPRFLIIKNATDTTHATSYSWVMVDTARYPDNRSAGNLNPLYANKSASENLYGTGSGTATGLALDVLSNGFKVRSGNAELNFSGTYIYYAVAENPFQANGGLAR